MNIDVIGVLELSSIADGFKTLDTVVKESPVIILKAEVINPGKYLIIITGDVASVETAMDAGIKAAGVSLIDHILLSNMDKHVIPSINTCHSPLEWDAVGLLETFSVAAAVEAADRSVKEANVHIVEIVTGNESGGKAMLKISGTVGDIEAAMNSAVALVRGKGQLCSNVIIPRPHGDVKGYICGI
ncbi:MAG: BMC domain-containing protein [Candidatus Brocadiales bacterium]|nr:BMC domain-containing protein [Candidatus Brocadiales bacterium]